MYIPSHFHETDLAQLDWLAAHDAFGTLFSTVDNAPFATHLPVLYRRDGNYVTLTGHWAKPNPQWTTIDSQRAMFIFHGPHTYISPRWYTEPNRNVPTWNYAVAHLYGNVRVFQDREKLTSVVSQLAAQYERGVPAPWTFEESNASRLLGGIVGFELVVDDIQIKFKLNQNHTEGNVMGAIEGLAEQRTDDAAAVAELMKDALSKRVAR